MFSFSTLRLLSDSSYAAIKLWRLFSLLAMVILFLPIVVNAVDMGECVGECLISSTDKTYEECAASCRQDAGGESSELKSGLESAKEAAKGLPAYSTKTIIDKAINFLLGLLGTLALVGVIWGGFQYILAFADESRAEKGKNMIKWSIIGLLIVGLAAAIVNTVLRIL